MDTLSGASVRILKQFITIEHQCSLMEKWPHYGVPIAETVAAGRSGFRTQTPGDHPLARALHYVEQWWCRPASTTCARRKGFEFLAIPSAEIVVGKVISEIFQCLFNIRSQVFKILNAAGITHERLRNP